MLLTLASERIGKAPFAEDEVGTMMDSIEKSRSVIQQHADLIDKQDIDQRTIARLIALSLDCPIAQQYAVDLKLLPGIPDS